MPARSFTDSEEEQIAKIYLAGNSAKAIARAYGLSHHISITSALKRQQVKQRKPADRNRLYQLNKYVFDKIDNELTAYWWGFLYADGGVYKRSLRLGLSIKDKKQVEKLKEFLECEHPVKVTEEKLNNKVYKKAVLFVTSKYLTNRLRELGIIKGRPNFDEAIKQLPDDLVNHWIRGYLDGDGSIKKSMAVSFVGQEPVLNWIRKQLAEKAQTNPKLKIQYVKNKEIRRLTITGRLHAKKAIDFMYNDAITYLIRKRKIVENWPIPQEIRRNKKGQFI